MVKPDLPGPADNLATEQPDVWEAFQRLGEACSKGGPLDSRTRHLVKIAIAIATRSEGATHSHVRRAIADGLSIDEIRHVALLVAPTFGFPQAVAGLTWIDDIANPGG